MRLPLSLNSLKEKIIEEIISVKILAQFVISNRFFRNGNEALKYLFVGFNFLFRSFLIILSSS